MPELQKNKSSLRIRKSSFWTTRTSESGCVTGRFQSSLVCHLFHLRPYSQWPMYGVLESTCR